MDKLKEIIELLLDNWFPAILIIGLVGTITIEIIKAFK